MMGESHKGLNDLVVQNGRLVSKEDLKQNNNWNNRML